MNSNFVISVTVTAHSCMYVCTVTDTRRGTAVRRKKIKNIYTTLLVLMCDWYYCTHAKVLVCAQIHNMHLRYIEPSTPVCTRRCTTPYTRVPGSQKISNSNSSKQSRVSKQQVSSIERIFRVNGFLHSFHHCQCSRTMVGF